MKRICYYTSGLFLAICGCLFSLSAHAATYSFYRSITVTSSASVASGTNANFPMLVSSTVSSWESVSNGGRIQHLVTAPNGGQEPADLVFATSSANCGVSNLNFETESYVSSTGALIDWVNVPSVSTGTVIYACYDASTVSTDQSHPSSTWNSNYAAVYHLASPTSTLQSNDSTANANNGTNTSPSNVTGGSGQIDGGGSFPGTSAETQGIDTPSINLGTSFSVEAWAEPAGNSDNNYARIAENNYQNGFYLGPDANQNFPFLFIVNGNFSTTGGSGLTYGTWYHVVGTYNGSTATLYVDGTAVAATSVSAPSIGSSAISIGYSAAHGLSEWGGGIDEVRFPTTPLSPSWVLTEYNNQSSPSTFYTISSEQAASTPTNDAIFFQGD